MNRIQKGLVVENIEKMFTENESVFVVSSSKVKSQDSQNLRKILKGFESEVRVVKNTLLRIVAKRNEIFSLLEPFFNDQVSLIFSKRDTLKVASLVKDFSRGALGFNAGIFDGKILNKEQFDLIAKIKDKNILYSRLCSVLMSPVVKLVFFLKKVSDKGV